jgi:FlaA1/EpsC-like NDP-sugar epimerase
MDFATKEFLIIFWLITFCFLGLARLLGFRLIYLLRSRGRNLRNLVIIGEGPDAFALAHRIEQEIALGYRVLRIITTKDQSL